MSGVTAARREAAKAAHALVAAEAQEALTLALVTMASRGQRPRCGDPVTGEMWLSDISEERSTAAGWCAGCPVLVECGQAAAATGEAFGVWGGVDRTPKPQRQRQEAA
ncbi:MAG TPA: WhiB family transcriptional regulator [Propionibacteriaceae bacterium]